MKRALTVILSGLLIWANTVSSKEYDLHTILKLAEENNKEIQLARAELKLASAQKLEAWSTALPRLDVDLNYNRNFFQNVFFFTITDSTGRRTTNRFTVSFRNEFQINAVLSQTLFGFGKIGNAIKAAGYFDHFTDLQFTTRWQQVITRVKKAYYQTLLLQKVWEVAKASEESARDNYQNVKARYESGMASEFDLLQAEVRWQNAIPETMKAHKEYELALNNLKVLVDLPLSEEVRLVGSLENYPPLPDTIEVNSVLRLRPDYNALLWEKKLRERRVAVEFADHLPTLTGNLIYTYSARSDVFRLENDNDNLILGITLKVPIFSGGFTTAQVQKAQIDVEKVKTRIEMLNDNIHIELKNVHLRLQEAHQRILAARKSVNTARRAFEIAASRVENGMATQLELKDSRVFLDQAQLNYYSAIYDYLDAYFDWERTTGNVSFAGF